MNPFGGDLFAPAPVNPVSVELYTDAYRIAGTLRTRFERVADIVNQLTSGQIVVEGATITEYAAPDQAISAPQAVIALDDLLFMLTEVSDPSSRPEMRIPKRAVRAQLALPPFRLAGAIHVPQGTRPVDGVLNLGERFMAVTDVAIGSAAHPAFARSAPAVAVQRSRAQLILVDDDERPEELLADVLDEPTAQGWLQRDQRGIR